MMKARGADHYIRQAMTFEIQRAEFRMVDAEHFHFDLRKILGSAQSEPVDFREMIRERPGHHYFTHVMHEAGHVIRLVSRRLHGADDFARQNRGADGMLPKTTPGKIALLGEPLKIFDDRRHHRELAN